MLLVEEQPEVALRPENRSESQTELQTVAVVGLGYVGLPVAVEFGRRRPTVGYDLSRKKVASLRHFIDTTGEVTPEQLQQADKLRISDDPALLAEADYIIVAVPTPVNSA